MSDGRDAGLRGDAEGGAPAGSDAGASAAHPQAEDAARPDAEDAATEEDRVRAVIEELRRLRVEDLALDMAVNLVTVGYQKLGLTDQTRELRDLDGARLSIELLRACLDVLERERGATSLGDLRGTLAAMQLNYARAVAGERPAADTASAADAEPGAAAAPAAGAEPAAGVEPQTGE